MVSLLPTKFHEILFSSFRGVALTNCVTDRWTDRTKTICLPTKFDKLESEIVYMRKEIDEIKQIQKTQGDILELEENHHHEIADGMTTQENLNFDVEAEKYELKEQFLKLQSHSMKYN